MSVFDEFEPTGNPSTTPHSRCGRSYNPNHTHSEFEVFMNLNWIILIIGGLFETGFAICLGKAQQTSGKELVWWVIGFAICVSMSMYLLFKAMGGDKAIPVGTAYAVWGAIGAIGTVVAGIVLFKEPVTFWRMFFLATLVISVIGLQTVSSHE